MNILLGLLITLPILIVVHEFGHYQVARWCGVKVLRFSFGFGQVIWRRQSSPQATEFVISALPLGGYVRMLGHDQPYRPDEARYAFDAQPLVRRAAIIAAGPLVNLLLAALLYAAVHWIGVDETMAVLATPPARTLAADAGLSAGDQVMAVSSVDGEWHDVATMRDLQWQLTQATVRGEDLQLQVSDQDGGHRRQVLLQLSQLAGEEVEPATLARIGIGAPFSPPEMGRPVAGGPAERAALRAGDLVLSMDGVPVPDAVALVERIRAHPTGDVMPMRWVVERGGQRIELEVSPRSVTENGKTFGRIDAPVSSRARTVHVRLGPWDGFVRGVQRTWDMSAFSLKMLGRIVTGQASLRNLSGPLTIGDFASQAIQHGFTDYLAFLAMVSVSLGVLNLLPLPMLDGGHLMYYLFEGVTGRPVSELWLKRLQLSGAFVLLLLVTIALSNDMARMLGLQ
ncbi:RIP metalloprotease RseP [Ideonella sp. DXS29W]|uniref:Zinc metalloprotease n=1 Tax=Ideonella lacteola TaxID=2984193 RepID=A0ABU9BYX3_9BURK